MVGVGIGNGSTVKNTGGGMILNGTAKLTNSSVTISGSFNTGVSIEDNGTEVSATGDITGTGQGGGIGNNSGYNYGIVVYNQAVVATSSAGNITFTGTGGDGAGGNDQGIVITGAQIETTGTGNISMTGTHGSSTVAPYNHGIQINGGSALSNQGGNISLTGFGSGMYSSGIAIRSNSTLATTGVGNIMVKGYTFGGTATDSDTIATRLSSGSISVVDGIVTVVGDNLTNDTNSPVNTQYSLGLFLSPEFTVQTTDRGNLVLEGTGGGTAASGNNWGILLAGKVRALGSGSISITGTAGSAAIDPYSNGNYGVFVGFTGTYYDDNSWNNTGAEVTTASGNISITGINNHTSSGGASQALTIGSDGSVAASGSGNVTVHGQGSSGSVSIGFLSTEYGDITVEAMDTAFDVILDNPVSSTYGNIVLAARRNFINNLPTGTGIVPETGRYLVYSTSPAASVPGMSGHNVHYGQLYHSGSVPSYAASGNWFLYSWGVADNVKPNINTIPVVHPASGIQGGTTLVNDGVNTGGQPVITNNGNTAGFRVSQLTYLNSNQSGNGLIVNHALTDVSGSAQTFIKVPIPADTFATTDPNPVVRLSATLADGRALPEWLRFDPVNGSFSGIPPLERTKNFTLK